ncbi:MAG TPA: hypothetical protein VLB27_01115, partial [candidate division Zixibacteria bacterium]|nr:hypothetical protein [candidate division Zixibacteria bacterium]
NPPAPITAVAPRSRTFAGAATPQRVAIDGAAQGERFLLRIDGIPVALTGKSFKYFVRLAAGRFLSEDGWVYKDDIEQGFNQARYLYRMRREIEAGLPGYRWPVYENNRLGYYRLGLAAAAVEVNLEALAASDDFEIAETAQALAARAEHRRSA